jgi:hypothetical protein
MKRSQPPRIDFQIIAAGKELNAIISEYANHKK